jgi:solute carrier family 39 (zinc transporter), member 1/2/3
MEILWFKGLAVLIIVMTAMAGGYISIRIGKSFRADKLLPLGDAFAAGIFLGAGLLHMLPDAQENFNAFAGDMDFPVVLFVCGCGFLLIFFLERVLLGGEDVGDMSKGRPVYPYVLTLVLSVHSIIAGTSLGLDKALISSVVIFIAIIAHKGSAAFALSSSLRAAEFPIPKSYGIIALFSIMTPAGILIGTAFNAFLTSRAALGIEAIFDALAAGTFVYVGIVDIMAEVFSSSRDCLLKFGIMTTAFGFMALLAAFV